jgi:carboxyl-terminal processing protease
MNRRMLYAIILALTVCGCRKTIPVPVAPDNYPITSFSAVFESYWNGMNERYVFWDWDSTNWDSIYRQYKPLFSRLDSEAKSYSISWIPGEDTVLLYLEAMTANLIDGHYAIQSLDIRNGADTSFRPSYLRKSNDSFFVANPQIFTPYFRNVLPSDHLNQAHVSDSAFYQGDTVFAVSGTIGGHILYLYFKSFHLQRFYNVDDSLNATLKFFFDRFTADSAQTYDGIIFDVRDNYGGEIQDFDFILGSIVQDQVPYGYVRTKNGNGRLDYSPWTTVVINPAKGAKPLAPSQKIVVLADDWSQSAAEQFTMAVKRLPNSKFIGTTTWGATGPFFGSDDLTDLFSGPFNIGVMGTSEATTKPYGIVKTSSCMFKYINDSIYEGRGFPPDIMVRASDSAALFSGVDSALQTAINFLKQ